MRGITAARSFSITQTLRLHWDTPIRRSRCSTRTALCLAASIALAAASPAQEAGEPPKLTRMRQIYEQEVAKFKLPILRKLAGDLDQLEQRLTREDQLEEAVKARAERLKIETLLLELETKSNAEIKAPAKAADEPVTERKEFSIPVAGAKLQGRLKRPRSGGYITNWVASSCEANWSGGQVVPGFYDVYIDFDTFWQRSGGQLRFEELSQDFHCVIPGRQARKTMKVGTFKLGSALGFTIKANSKNPYGIIRLHGVTFKPSAQQ